MNRRTKFLFFALLSTLSLTLLSSFLKDRGVLAIGGFVLINLIFTLISLWEDLSGLEFLTLLFLPVLFSFSMITTLWNFPNFSLFFRILFYGLYFVFYYTMLLSLNIFNVVEQKRIPLLRAAYTSSFVITIFTSFPLFTFVYKGYYGLPLEIVLVLALTFILSFQSLWTVFLPGRNDLLAFKASLILTLVTVETALTFSFLPIESFFRSLLLSAFFYIFLGFTHQFLKKNLSQKNILEYILVGFFVVALVFLY